MSNFQAFKDKLILEDGKMSPEHDELLRHVKGLLQKSRKTMSEYYSTWDYHDKIFRSRRKVDAEDRKATRNDEPSKMIVPLTFSQIMTFVSFCVMSVTQNKRFFELEYEGQKAGPEEVLKDTLEVILERDCRRNQWNNFLIQYFLDIARFWIGAAEICYKEEYRNIRVSQTENVAGAFGVQTPQSTTSFQKIPTFVGNKVYPVSPYRIFPDTRLPLTRFQEGEFCGSEDMFGLASLQSDSDNLFNLDMIPKMSEKDYTNRKSCSRIDEMEFVPTRTQSAETVSESTDKVKAGSVIVSKIVFDLIPKNFKINDKKVLGNEDFPVRYICWYANDATIIRFEEAYYLHGQFPYIISQFLPDQHQTINEGLSAVCDQITSLITWKLNAHLTSQKNSVESKWIIDPAGIDVKSLDSRSPYMFLKKNASQTGVDRYIKQFITQDVTAGVMGDVASLKDLLESVTGISGQMQGQYSTGRRSATQDRVVAQGASARAKTTLSGIWDSSFEPLGKQFLANNRQEMDIETFVRIVGVGPFGPMQDVQVQDLYAMFKADPVSIATSEDFFVFDGTLPSEKAFLAQSLQEVLMQILQNPEMMQILGYGPEQVRYLFDEIYELRGVTPPALPVPMPLQQPGGAPLAVLPPPNAAQPAVGGVLPAPPIVSNG